MVKGTAWVNVKFSTIWSWPPLSLSIIWSWPPLSLSIIWSWPPLSLSIIWSWPPLSLYYMIMATTVSLYYMIMATTVSLHYMIMATTVSLYTTIISCLIYVICVCLCKVVSNTYCVVFLFSFFFVLYTLCCQFLWIVHFWLPLRYSKRYKIKNINYKPFLHPWTQILFLVELVTVGCYSLVYMPTKKKKKCKVTPMWKLNFLRSFSNKYDYWEIIFD